MSKKVARYEQLEQQEQKFLLEHEKKQQKYALARRINKATNLKLLQMLLADEATKTDITTLMYLSEVDRKSAWGDIADRLHKSYKYHNEFKEILLELLPVSDDFVNSRENVLLLYNIAEYKSEMVRPLKDWVVPNRNIKDQAFSLLHHAFTKYEVPEFLLRGFFTNNVDMIFLFFHITQGNSMKSFNAFPNIPVSKKAYHLLYTTPYGLTLRQAFRRIQVLYMGGNDYLFNAFMGSKVEPENLVRRDDGGEEFWSTVIQFFCNNPMIERNKVSEIVDYIHNQKYVSTTEIRDRVRVVVPPPQPGLTMKGRTAESLLRQSDEWHEQVARIKVKVGTVDQWEPQLIGDYEHLNGEGKIVWLIKQLTTTKQLTTEGRRMHHCVATYASSCSKGLCAIFSMRDWEDKPHVTIEVRGRSIAQIRCSYNKRPTDSHMFFINKWASENNLQVSKWAI